jgi:hypothetical protein
MLCNKKDIFKKSSTTNSKKNVSKIILESPIKNIPIVADDPTTLVKTNTFFLNEPKSKMK